MHCDLMHVSIMQGFGDSIAKLAERRLDTSFAEAKRRGSRAEGAVSVGVV